MAKVGAGLIIPGYLYPLNELNVYCSFENRIDGGWEGDLKSLCSWCGRRFTVRKGVLDVIHGITRNANLTSDKSPCLELPAGAWDAPRLLSECPLCHKPLKYSSFIVDNRDPY